MSNNYTDQDSTSPDTADPVPADQTESETKDEGGGKPKGWSNLIPRIISALCIAPIVLAATYFGEPYFFLMIAAAAALMAMEWSNMVGAKQPAMLALILVTGLAASLAHAEGLWASTLVLAIVGSLFFVRRFVQSIAGSSHKGKGFWMATGVVYIGLPCSLFVWLRDMPSLGMETVIWLFILVWATDTGAYIVGRSIGGPKLAPKLSPNKTWAGLLGGMLCAGIAGEIMVLVMDGAAPIEFGLASAIIGGLSQGGDLFESWVKRRFGKKDSGTLIPGHGGILDRVDGLLAAIVAVGLLEWATGGQWRLWM